MSGVIKAGIDTVDMTTLLTVPKVLMCGIMGAMELCPEPPIPNPAPHSAHSGI